MEFQVMARELTELLKRTGSKNEHIREAIRYRNPETRTTIPIAKFTTAEIKTLREVVDDRLKAEPEDRHNKWLKGRIRAYYELTEGRIEAGTPVKKLDQLPIAIKRYLEQHAPHRWLFKQNDDDKMSLPYFVTDLTYQKRRRDRDGEVYPAYVRMTVVAYEHNSSTSSSATWDENDFATGRTVSGFLRDAGYVAESEEAVKQYYQEMDHFGELQNACGLQMYALGDGYVRSASRWSDSWGMQPMVRNGMATKVVVDPTSPEVGENKNSAKPRNYHKHCWDAIPDRNGLTTATETEPVEDEYGDTEEAKILDVMLPMHPYLYVFDLDKHQWIDIHVNNLSVYPWNKQLITKLVLPEEQKQLLEILISTTHSSVEDIIKGKMSGVIVLATGRPGVGKTLTAEVFSEYIEKPLYTVQCSQLGLDVNSIESNLQTILSRAARWGAVLLIDEADVYIRRRGEDITQNAIVGVFLRLLEYYRGVLFMTSNRGEIIDDAILSRASAWIQYELPSPELLKRIWAVLGTQYKIKLTGADINKLINKLPALSGRSVRNILKLATLLKGAKADVNTLLEVSRYQALEGDEKEEVAAVA